jgi:aryl-alcohol dehydrogenase-like predicted oxidoreductase
MHHVDEYVTWDELWDVFESLTLQGKVCYVGSSNFAGWHLVKAQATAKERNFLGLVSEQHKYNLVCRYPELEVLPAAKNLGVGIMVYSPLSGGTLAGKEKQAMRRRSSIGTKTAEQFAQQLAEYSEFCKDLGEKEADVALAWLLANPVVTSPVIGPRTLEQFEGSLRAVDLQLDNNLLVRLDKIFPGHGGEAPKAYAW